jgi:hypothetical protein
VLMQGDILILPGKEENRQRTVVGRWKIDSHIRYFAFTYKLAFIASLMFPIRIFLISVMPTGSSSFESIGGWQP